jgi:hypothetical protein
MLRANDTRVAAYKCRLATAIEGVVCVLGTLYDAKTVRLILVQHSFIDKPQDTIETPKSFDLTVTTRLSVIDHEDPESGAIDSNAKLPYRWIFLDQ